MWALCPERVSKASTLVLEVFYNGVLLKELNISYHTKEALLYTIDPFYGNLK